MRLALIVIPMMLVILTVCPVRGETASIAVLPYLKQVYVASSDRGLNDTGYVAVRNTGEITLEIRLSYSMEPKELGGKIRISIETPRFIIAPGEEGGSRILISVLRGAAVGMYSLTIYVEAVSAEPANGNIIVPTQKVSTKILVGKYSYRLTVILKQPDGTYVFGLIRISLFHEGTLVPLYQQAAANYTFYVVEGRYLVEAYLGGKKRASQEVNVTQDTLVVLMFSSIYVSDFTIVYKPTDPRDALIFRLSIRNDDPLIYRKTVDVILRLKNDSAVLIDNITLAQITIRSTVTKTMEGFVPPPGEWQNQTYTIEILLLSKGKILYNYTTDVKFLVYSPVKIIHVTEIPLPYLAGTVGVGILFGFIGAKYALKRIIREYIPRAVGLLYGGRVVALDVWAGRFVRPELLSGEWHKVVYGFGILTRRYWRKREAIPVTITINAEKWIFHPITRDVVFFLQVHAALNEYDLREELESLREYFEEKIREHTALGVLADPEETLSDLPSLMRRLFG